MAWITGVLVLKLNVGLSAFAAAALIVTHPRQRMRFRL
jgi:hypothetical protein